MCQIFGPLCMSTFLRTTYAQKTTNSKNEKATSAHQRKSKASTRKRSQTQTRTHQTYTEMRFIIMLKAKAYSATSHIQQLQRRLCFRAGIQPIGRGPSPRHGLDLQPNSRTQPWSTLWLSSPRDPCNYMDYYSFTDPGRIEGWVGLVGWPIAESFPHKVVTCQPESPPSKDRSPMSAVWHTVASIYLLHFNSFTCYDAIYVLFVHSKRIFSKNIFPLSEV